MVYSTLDILTMLSLGTVTCEITQLSHSVLSRLYCQAHYYSRLTQFWFLQLPYTLAEPTQLG